MVMKGRKNIRSRWNSERMVEGRRLRLLGVLFSFLIMVILYRAFTFQVLHREPWNKIAPDQHQRRVGLMAERGIIYDRKKQILSMDMETVSMAMDPSQVDDVRGAASILSEILGEKPESYREDLEEKNDKHFIWIDRDITENQRQLLIDSNLPGLIFLQGRKRVRPYQDLGKPVLGITNAEHRGVGGVEQACEHILQGEDGWAIYQRDGLNRNFLSIDYPVREPVDGSHVVLTIDHLYQTIVEEELQRGSIRHEAKAGSAILLDPFTGEILAMASVLRETRSSDKPSINEYLRNQAVQVDFEPGSTFKIVTAAAALEEGIFQPNSLVHCENGTYRLAGHTIHDHHKAYYWLTLSRIVEVSSNIGMAKIGKKLGNKTLYKYIQNFGFGNRTGIELPGEASGILRPVYHWTDFSTAMISFGQEISATTLQMALMAAVVANGGELMQPQIIKALLDRDGREVKTNSPQVIRRVISERTANQLTSILQGVVLQGNGTEAAVEGVRVAGKTGTAQKSIPGYKGYYPGAYVSSFVGFWPAEAPMFVLVVVLDEARELYWGSTSAAPVFSRIVSRMIGLPMTPRTPPGQEKQDRDDKKRFVFTSFEEDREPPPLNDRNRQQSTPSPYHVPGLLGLSLREALLRLGAIGIEARVQGSGVVVAQEPEPNTRIEKGTVCRLTCKEYRTERTGR